MPALLAENGVRAEDSLGGTSTQIFESRAYALQFLFYLGEITAAMMEKMMAFGSLSLEARGSEMVRELGISLAFLSALTGVERTKLSMGFRQLKKFEYADAAVLSSTLRQLLELRDALTPLTIDLTNPAKTRLAIDAFEGLDVEQIREKVNKILER